MDVQSLMEMDWNGDNTCGKYKVLYEDENCSWTYFRIEAPTVPHRHDFDEIYFIQHGHALMKIGDEVEGVGNGSRIFIPRNQVHQIIPDESTNSLEMFVLTSPRFDPALINEVPGHYCSE